MYLQLQAGGNKKGKYIHDVIVWYVNSQSHCNNLIKIHFEVKIKQYFSFQTISQI